MIVGIPKEIVAGETRVSAVPETVAKMVKAGMGVHVATNAGINAFISDQAYQDAGALIVNAKALYNKADVILKIQRPQFDEDTNQHEVEAMKEHATLICPLDPFRFPDLLTKLKEKKISAFALDLLPRIARAQSMDILSSMSNLSGYKSIILAADHLAKFFPMLTTAAGNIPPAKVIVIGAGVAGLQAIATARRLGGVVIAFDTRPIVQEQVKSLGADFISLESSHQTEDAGGYAKEQSAEYYQQEQTIIRKYIKEADVVITTALIPGKRAPQLITESMVKEMQPGSVIVDLANEQGGNCELTISGKIIIKHDVTVIGLANLPSTMPKHASMLFAKNLFTFLNYVAPQLENHHFDFEDQIIKECLVTHNGEILHQHLKG